MSARVRQSAPAQTPRRLGNELPPYEPPTFSLNPAAQRDIFQLHHYHSLTRLDETLQKAQTALTHAATGINDRLTSKAGLVEKRRAAESSNDGPQSPDGSDEQQNLSDLRGRVDRMTQRMDETMRKIIDGRHSVVSMRTSLTNAHEGAKANASTQASTQHGPSQRKRRRVVTDGEENESGEDSDEYQDFEPTDPAAGTQSNASAIEIFRSKLEDAKTKYQSHSLTARYADNNEYRDFRRMVHDAQYPLGEKSLAHQSEWFKEQDPPAPGVTTRTRINAEQPGGEGDDDDDIAVSRANISTKCPLTLQELTAPLTSRKCPHSFESAAILSMISNSTNRENDRRDGERYVRCPVTGCSQHLTRADLHVDNVLIRKIKRIQRARELEDEDDEDTRGAGGSKRAPTVLEDADDGADVDDIVEGRVVPQTQMKTEPSRIVAARAAPASTAPPSSVAPIDLGDDDNSSDNGNDDDDEEETEEENSSDEDMDEDSNEEEAEEEEDSMEE